ncbi:Stealth protein CR4, conserved region 4 [Glycomyces sambucus]|uniref:Stealth protein CR4, conserved region 4 n=1 Tax=Glycomyces sambucus TaxID=380244 RepID=A0A1G9GQ40_9ACTN|nr:stealth family protein [Glycomyces sambucus]SDL02787.1 Stealth protein CR4, conserved region 4 [Glycomyces sambucus]
MPNQPLRPKALIRRALPARVRDRIEARRREARRDALVAADPALRTFERDGRTLVGRRVESFTAAGAAESSLRLVAEAAEAAGVEYFLVPSFAPARHVVGMRRADKKAFLEAVRERHGSGDLYAAKPGSGDAIAAGPALYAEGALPDDVKRSRTLRFGRYLLGPADQVLGGLEFGCDVEFWADGEEFAADPAFERKLHRVKVRVPASMFAGAWVAPRPNRVADVLPAEARVPVERTVGERKYPAFEPYTRKLVDDVDFPVDAVYMWVDGADPEWEASRRAHLGGESAAHSHLSGTSRYTDHDELRYSLRSLHAFAPFVRNVYLVTAGQTPDWLDTGAPGLTVVDHRDIFEDPSVLPVFNSHAITTQLHRIPGLADHYLVLNDDVCFGGPSRAEQFFHANGIARAPFSSMQIGLGRALPEDSAPNSAGRNVRALLEADFGRFTVSKFKHVPLPQLRPVAFELAERYPEAVAATAASRFRDTADIEFSGMLHHYSVLTGRAVPGASKLLYIDVAEAGAAERLAELAVRRDMEFFCVNDVDTPADRVDEIDALVRGFLDGYFPFPSPYERR